ncbi:hypothetical protein [Candidatus Poriferisodalis sp.]
MRTSLQGRSNHGTGGHHRRRVTLTLFGGFLTDNRITLVPTTLAVTIVD